MKPTHMITAGIVIGLQAVILVFVTARGWTEAEMRQDHEPRISKTDDASPGAAKAFAENRDGQVAPAPPSDRTGIPAEHPSPAESIVDRQESVTREMRILSERMEKLEKAVNELKELILEEQSADALRGTPEGEFKEYDHQKMTALLVRRMERIIRSLYEQLNIDSEDSFRKWVLFQIEQEKGILRELNAVASREDFFKVLKKHKMAQALKFEIEHDPK